MLLRAPASDRMPHLLFAAASYVLSQEGHDFLEAFGEAQFSEFHAWCLSRRAKIEALVSQRVVQTNEVGRCAALLPCLSMIANKTGRPLALVEVGCSAGLNLRMDRYRYVYGELEVGSPQARVVLRPKSKGEAMPHLAVPEVAWRMGIDRRPVDVFDNEDVRWLESCVWPEQHERRALLHRAVEAARGDPAPIVRGDALEVLEDVTALAPGDAELCILHSAVLPYMPQPHLFVELLRRLSGERPFWWVSGEGEGMVRDLCPPRPTGTFAQLYGVVPLGMAHEEPCLVARASSHGSSIDWADGARRTAG